MVSRWPWTAQWLSQQSRFGERVRLRGDVQIGGEPHPEGEQMGGGSFGLWLFQGVSYRAGRSRQPRQWRVPAARHPSGWRGFGIIKLPQTTM